MTLKRKRYPLLVHIKLRDHGTASVKELSPFPCEVVGWLYKRTKHYYYICSWVSNGAFKDSTDSDGYAIVRGGIKSMRVLK